MWSRDKNTLYSLENGCVNIVKTFFHPNSHNRPHNPPHAHHTSVIDSNYGIIFWSLGKNWFDWVHNASTYQGTFHVHAPYFILFNPKPFAYKCTFHLFYLFVFLKSYFFVNHGTLSTTNRQSYLQIVINVDWYLLRLLLLFIDVCHVHQNISKISGWNQGLNLWFMQSRLDTLSNYFFLYIDVPNLPKVSKIPVKK